MQEKFSTPMMKQYVAIKKQYMDCLLFYRMGDFYELFMDDAQVGAKVLNITLTSRAKGKDGRIPMAGVPYHAVDAYLNKLVKAGFKVAICEQVSLPSKTGIIDREVVRIVTPGTILDEKALEKKENNYIVALHVEKNIVAMTIADVSTGYFATTEIKTQYAEQTIKNELARIHPAECILPEALYNDPQMLRIIKTEKGINIFPFFDWDTYATDAATVLKNHFGIKTLAGFGIQDQKVVQKTAAVLLGYLQQTQKGPVHHIKKISSYETKDHLVLDKSTIINLELFSTIREHDSHGTLLSVLDHTVTAMGGRLLKQWIREPLVSKKEIAHRHDAVSELFQKRSKRNLLREKIKEVSDIERLLSRLSVGLGNARDLINLKNSLTSVVEIKHLMKKFESPLLQDLANKIQTDSTVILVSEERTHPESLKELAKKDSGPSQTRLRQARMTRDLDEVISYLNKNIVEEPPISIREGGMIAANVDLELDRLRKIVGGSRDWIVELEKQERETTGINSLKVRYNQVFGFYIEVSKANLSSVPVSYMRKQTLVNAERFITPELKEQEEIILSAEQKMHDIEYAYFQKILTHVLDHVAIIQDAAQSIAAFDCLLNFAYLAEKRNYTRPALSESGELHLIAARHPVVETLLEDAQFVPNDVTLDNTNQQLLLITGPNMAGKSVFIRQVAQIVLMAQMGSFVPAEKAEISLVDQIFVRSGASDVITSGLSTFMVEMVETAHILHHATGRSLIVMDEIGRGTSTYDGISIAWAVAEYLVTSLTPSPKTLFATHYHELQVLEEQYPKHIKNYHMAVAEENGEPIFLHTILPGGASHSFGVAVAKLAGIPDQVIGRANELLIELEKRSESPSTSLRVEEEELLVIPQQMHLADHLIHKELELMDIHQMTPLDALNKLSDLKEKLKLVSIQDKKFFEAD